MIHLVTGGVRAGKSRYALAHVEEVAPAGTIGFVATAEGRDREMQARIARHQEERGDRFVTLEAPLDPDRALRTGHAAYVVDCLTLWASNLILAEHGVAWIEERVASFVTVLAESPTPVVVVTNEVGLGIIPADALSRQYQDVLGRLNQRVAHVATRVTLVVAGIPVPIKQ